MPTLQTESDQPSSGSAPAETATDAAEPEQLPEDIPQSNGLSLDIVFDVLRNQRRRLVLQAVEDHDGSTTLSTLAEHIAGIENDKPPSALNAQERKRVYVGLYQCHLPKMDDAGAVEFDQDRGTVERGPNVDMFHTYLERETESDRPWHRYYAGHAGLSGLFFLLAVTLFDDLISIVFAGSMILLVLLAAVHSTYISD